MDEKTAVRPRGKSGHFNNLLTRLKMIGMAWSRLRILFYLLRRRRFKAAWGWVWIGLFTRNAGLALADIFIRRLRSWAPYPKTMEMEVTTRCNMRCVMCEHTYWKEPARDMSFDEFKHIVSQFPKLKWIGMTGIGSSFLNKDYLRMLGHLRERDVCIELYDSFNYVTDSILQELVDLEVEKIFVSMEGATKETYEANRVGGNFERVVANLKRLFELKRRRKTPFPEVWFHYIITSRNIHEMPAFADLVHSIVGDDGNYATAIFWTRLLEFKEVEGLVPDPELIERLKPEVMKRCKKHGIRTVWNENITRDKPVTQCTNWTEPFVLVTGHVQPCCVINEANDRDHQKKYALGNLLEEDFREIWRSERHRRFRNQIWGGELPTICKNCRIHVECKARK